MSLIGRNLIDPHDFTREELESVVDLAHTFIHDPKSYEDLCKGKILATLFYEASTRTKFSFESAMLRLGGNIIGFSDPNTSSTSKGETVADTIRVMSYYADVIAMRHPVAGTPKEAAKYASVPIINAGDGGNQHPTQTLTDLVTINELRGSLNNLTIGFCGDLKNGRTVHSLYKTLTRFKGLKAVFISPEELSMPHSLIEDAEGGEVVFTDHLEDALGDLDILYMTRIQRERFSDLEEYERLKDVYILDAEKMKKAKDDMMVLHPLPRVNEIHTDVDGDKRAKYFEQSRFGIYARMALMAKLLGVK